MRITAAVATRVGLAAATALALVALAGCASSPSASQVSGSWKADGPGSTTSVLTLHPGGRLTLTDAPLNAFNACGVPVRSVDWSTRFSTAGTWELDGQDVDGSPKIDITLRSTPTFSGCASWVDLGGAPWAPVLIWVDDDKTQIEVDYHR